MTVNRLLYPGAIMIAAILLALALGIGSREGDPTGSDDGPPAESVPTAAGGSSSAPAGSEPPFAARLAESNVMVEMRDGVRLATDILRPVSADDGAAGSTAAYVEDLLPVLLRRTPYDKTAPGLVAQAEYFVRHGYVVVLQDTRGLYASEGEFQKYHEHDAPDGFDTIAWIRTLPYADGQVAMWGTSYGAHTQADAAKLDPPGLATLVLNMGGLSDGWDHKVRNHGAFELAQQLGWAHLQLVAETDDPTVRELLNREPVSDWFDRTPFRRGENPLSVAPSFEDYYLTMQGHGDYDDYWKGIGRNWVEYYERTADIPMLHVGGWYDTYAGGTIRNYSELSRRKTAPMRLIMGPWTHGGNTRSIAGDVEFGQGAAIPDFYDAFHLRWFDHRLKGRATAAADLPPIRLFVMGSGDGSRDGNGRLVHGGYWLEAEAWPLPDAEPTAFYLHEGGALRRQSPPADSSSTTFTFDPSHPVPTIGGSFSGALKRGGYDQREREFFSLRGGSENGFYGSRQPFPALRDRPDVLVFQTEPLDDDVTVIGPVTARLFISSTVVDTDFTAKLVDVYPPSADWPDGFDLNITDGIVRARYRESRERAALMEPGTIYEITIEPFPTANVFKAGHRIRLDISSSNYPRFDVNPNTGEPLGAHTRMVPAENSVWHDAPNPSHVLLYLVPRDG